MDKNGQKTSIFGITDNMRTRKNDVIPPRLRQSKGQFYISYSCYNSEKRKMIRYNIKSIVIWIVLFQ